MVELIDQSWEWVQKPKHALEIIEQAGRTCYKSEKKRTTTRFVQMILKKGHESVIEHASASVRFVTNRGVTHELVRHRLCAFSQESTRYVNYGKQPMRCIKPVWWKEMTLEAQGCFMIACDVAARQYAELLRLGQQPQHAREVLPNALKTEIVVTANLREWRHIFRLRTSAAAHPQMRSLMRSCLAGFKEEVPIIFDDL